MCQNGAIMKFRYEGIFINVLRNFMTNWDPNIRQSGV